MIRRPLRLIFDTVAGQVILLLVLSIVAMHAMLATYFFWESTNTHFPPASPAEMTGRISAYVELYETTAPAARPDLVATIRAAHPALGFGLAKMPDDAVEVPDTPLAHLVGAQARVFKPIAEKGDMVADSTGNLYFLMGDGTVLHADVPQNDFPGFFGPTSLTFGFLAIAAVLLLGWAIIVITGPLRRFAAAVEGFRDVHADVEIAENGPREIRAAIGAFNRLRARIVKLIDQKTKMLAAVSHDLRTPITRLRLRAEFIEDESIRAPMLADLDHMAALAQAALTHLSGSETRTPFDSADLPSLLETVADQFCDLGHAVSYAGPPHLTASVRLDDIRRAVTNLVDNAVRYGETVVISLTEPTPGRLAIAVVDDGPGIPAEDRGRLLEPFQRGDVARTAMPNSGFGLGLTIARDVAEGHGGGLTLGDATGGGLRAVIEIDREPRRRG